MDKHSSQSKPVCPRCGSDAVVMKSRTSVGDTKTDDVIRTEMIGCAVIFKYLNCEACGQNITRSEYESFQKGGTLP